MTAVNTWGTTIEQCRVDITDHVSEVEFQMRGNAPKWHLHAHGQELWLELEHSRVGGSVGPVSLPAAAPLTRVSIGDFDGGGVRLIIRVRGQVDYIVAQAAHVLVVRIAPSWRNIDLAEPLLREMAQGGQSSVNRLSTPAIEAPDSNPAITANRHRRSSQTANLFNQTAVESAIAPSAGSFPGLSTRASSESVTSPMIAQAVQPVAERLGTSSWVGQSRGPMVAIDPGHGGFDPGTETADGIAEKAVALAIARHLETALESRGIGAELTRNDDSFLSLRERTEFANRAHADLFISIHLNSSPDWNTSGVETYYLNNTTDRATIRLARIENGGDYGAVGESNLNYILTNLRQDYKAHESSSLARMIEAEVAATVDTTLGTRVKALGAKRGPFYVLVGAEMPSVLVECGFLSDSREAQLLIQPNYQAALADGIARAIVHYFNADAAIGNL
ncbi:MAG: N-acetylmuramoyl-L-alanine amidase [Deltaproteobacteria bacterium]|nr:N-acetylmuramoyl-L-alanine amidase [Deltaproteobacteria bacterium]